MTGDTPMQIPYEDFIWFRYPGYEETFHLSEENMDIGGGKLPRNSTVAVVGRKGTSG